MLLWNKMFSSCPEWVFPQAHFVYKLDPKDGFSIFIYFYWEFFWQKRNSNSKSK
jgi:hypothetical protein